MPVARLLKMKGVSRKAFLGRVTLLYLYYLILKSFMLIIYRYQEAWFLKSWIKDYLNDKMFYHVHIPPLKHTHLKLYEITLH